MSGFNFDLCEVQGLGLQSLGSRWDELGFDCIRGEVGEYHHRHRHLEDIPVEEYLSVTPALFLGGGGLRVYVVGSWADRLGE